MRLLYGRKNEQAKKPAKVGFTGLLSSIGNLSHVGFKASLVKAMGGAECVFAAAEFAAAAPCFPIADAEVDRELVAVAAMQLFAGLRLGRDGQGSQKTQGSDDGDQDFAKHGGFLISFSVSSFGLRTRKASI
jgi:hypothetical protein